MGGVSKKSNKPFLKRSLPLEIVPIPTPKGSEHPDPPHGEGLLPKHEFTMGLIAPKGKGKTTTIINLLDLYKGYFHKIYILSPTVKSDVKWEYAKKLPVLVENKPLKKWVETMSKQDVFNGPVQLPSVGAKLSGIVGADSKFSECIPEECFFHGDGVVKAVKKLLDQNKNIVDLLHEHGKMKTLADRILLICDDQVGSDLFVGPLKKYFVGANTRHRHHSASIIMVGQGYKEIPKTIRTGWTCLLIYSIGNMKELEVIYEEYPMDLCWDEWYRLYKIATIGKHDFLFIDMYGDENYRMRHGLSKALLYE